MSESSELSSFFCFKSYKAKIKMSAGLCFFLEALGANLLPQSTKLLGEFSSMQLYV